MEIIDYGGWLTEDLKDYYKETIKERERSEMFSDRRDLNKQAMLIMTEILKRRNDENE